MRAAGSSAAGSAARAGAANESASARAATTTRAPGFRMRRKAALQSMDHSSARGTWGPVDRPSSDSNQDRPARSSMARSGNPTILETSVARGHHASGRSRPPDRGPLPGRPAPAPGDFQSGYSARREKHPGGRTRARAREFAPRTLRERQGKGAARGAGVERPTRARPADPGVGDHADAGGRGQDHDLDRPRAGPGEARRARRRGAARAVARPVPRHEGRRHRRREVAGRARRRHQPALHRRHPRGLERAQPAGRDGRQPPAPRQRARRSTRAACCGGACST